MRTPRALREPAKQALESAEARARHPLSRPAGDLNAIREALYELMWNDVGILRDAAGLARAREGLAGLRASLEESGVSGSDLRYNLTWHDWLNLDSLITVSEAIRTAAEARRESRGAHFREDFPQTGDLDASSFSRLSLAPGGGAQRFEVTWQPVSFTRVRPGQSLLAS
jgi:fumarate reductase flavoprotein subunit